MIDLETTNDISVLPREFYARDTIEVARALLGKRLVYRSENGRIAGTIVETEAYLCDDPACHASRGMTPRNAPMFGEAGHAYVYFTYGMYHCLNTVTATEGIGEGVLIRAVEPTDGIDVMIQNRGTDKLTNLTSGPGKLCVAFGLDKRHNRLDLTSSELTIEDGNAPAEIVTTTRIGIRLAADLPLRFYIKGNPHVSRK